MKPTGAKIIRNGVSIPLDLVCRGTNENGLEVWTSVERFNPLTDRISVDVLPPMTTIQFGEDESPPLPTSFPMFALEEAQARFGFWHQLQVCATIAFVPMIILPWIMPPPVWFQLWLPLMLANTAFSVVCHFKARRALRDMKKAVDL